MKGRAVVMTEHMKPFEIREYDVPDPEPGAVVLKITQAGLCGSDVKMWHGETAIGTGAVPPSGQAMGHEGAGVIYKMGKGVTTDSLGRPIKEGDRLMYAAIVPCNRCYQCLNGNQNWCSSGGVGRAAGQWPYFVGTYADYYYITPNQPVFIVPPELPDGVLPWVNCAMGTVTEGLMRAGCKEGDYVVIQGAGGLGQNATAMAKDMGAHKVIILDGIEGRLELAKEFGADHTININEENTPEMRKRRVMELTNGRGADIVMELVGRSALVPEGVDFMTRGGSYLIIGTSTRGGRTVAFDPSTVLGGKKLIGSLMYRPSLLPVMMDMLVKNMSKRPYAKLVSHTYPLADVNHAFHEVDWRERQTNVTRAALIP
jgi:D-arabinose 1-dehydrogenase-like Zn-dependent alcohol dehydrogenase